MKEKCKAALRRHHKWLLPVAVVMLVVLVCLAIYGPTLGTVTEFDFDAVADQCGHRAGASVCPPDRMYNLDGSWTETARWSSGDMMVAIVRPLEGRKNVITKSDLGVLSPYKKYPEINMNNSYLHGWVETEVEVLEIVYSQRKVSVKAGDRIRVMEDYYFLDSRLPAYFPHWPEQNGKVMPVIGYRYLPMADGETYYVIGTMIDWDTLHQEGAEGMMFRPSYNGTFCLSNPETEDVALEANLRTVQAFMDKYGPK